MMSSAFRFLAVAVLSGFFLVARAQPLETPDNNIAKVPTKPYRVLSSGKHITIRSNKDIQHVMLWTTGGHRVVEQREINSPTYTFIIPVNDKIFFLMVGLNDGKIYTEKIGVQ